MSGEKRVGAGVIRLVKGDITKIPADAIVNAANAELAGGGGVDGAVHRAGGPEIMRALDRLRPAGGCPTGSAVATTAGNLPAKHVIHAVGPMWRGGGFGEEDLLASAHETALDLAARLGAAIVTLPAISTGVYGYPVEKAAPVALRAAVTRLSVERTPLRELIFVLFSDGAFGAFARALSALGC